jgi:hypothetical protein
MSELLNAYWPMILVAVAIGLIVGTGRLPPPKQRVTLSKAEAPVRPHMAAVSEERRSLHERQVPSRRRQRRRRRGRGRGDEMAAAASDVSASSSARPSIRACPAARACPTTCSG